jgi:hypothetical protein
MVFTITKGLSHMKQVILLTAVLAMSVLLADSAQAQTSERYRIAYSDPGGFTEKSDGWIAKRKAKQVRKFGEQTSARFEMNMLELRAFDKWLDEVWDEDYREFSRCFNMSRISPAMIRVEIESAPFPVEGYDASFRASGVAYKDGRIRVVYWNVSNAVGPQAAVDLVNGEIRNWMNWILTNKQREMWGVDPCGK